MNEIWNDIDGWPSYQVSNLGNVRTIGRIVKYPKYEKSTPAKIIQPANNGNDYQYVTIQIQNKRKNHYVHRLVAAAFHSNPDNLPEVNHKDGNKKNNAASNLEWSSIQSNRDHAKENDLVPFGERSGTSKLKENDVIEILKAFKNDPYLSRTIFGKALWRQGECDLSNPQRPKME